MGNAQKRLLQYSLSFNKLTSWKNFAQLLYLPQSFQVESDLSTLANHCQTVVTWAWTAGKSSQGPSYTQLFFPKLLLTKVSWKTFGRPFLWPSHQIRPWLSPGHRYHLFLSWDSILRARCPVCPRFLRTLADAFHDCGCSFSHFSSFAGWGEVMVNF